MGWVVPSVQLSVSVLERWWVPGWVLGLARGWVHWWAVLWVRELVDGKVDGWALW